MIPLINISSAVRRLDARESNDASTLAKLLCDDNFFVRRNALANEQSPRDVVELLWRAGASADLRGRGTPDPTIALEDLARLATLGPFGRELVATHPNAESQLLESIASDSRRPLRLVILNHRRCPSTLLREACVSMVAEERRLAARHPNTPTDLLKELYVAGVDSELQTLRPLEKPLPTAAIERLAGLGHCGRVIAAIQPNCPSEVLAEIAKDDDWQVRLWVLQNPNTPAAALEHLSSIDDDQVHLRLMQHPNAPLSVIVEAARHPHLEVRIAAARHPNAPAEALRLLASDGAYQVREIVASHPQMPRDTIDQLRRLGSVEDLLNFCEPDLDMPVYEIAELARFGIWPRRLAARHPNTSGATLESLACDADPVVREWAARHPSMPCDFLTLLERAGASRDLLGSTPPDLTLGREELEMVATRGPWAARLAAGHPNAPENLLSDFAKSDDATLRAAAASHANTPKELMAQLARDEVPEVRFAAANNPALSAAASDVLATDSIAGIRFCLIQNRAVADETIALMETDLNPDIAAAAKARLSAADIPGRRKT